MRSARCLLGWLLATAVWPVFAAATDNVHEAAFLCRQQHVAGCDGVCLSCHPPPQELQDFYLAGDLQLCGGCHPAQVYRPTAARYLLNLPGGGGNHPVGVAYPPAGENPQMEDAPQGVKLFCGPLGEGCKVYCSTCHDSMGDVPSLLSRGGGRLELCLSCHRK